MEENNQTLPCLGAVGAKNKGADRHQCALDQNRLLDGGFMRFEQMGQPRLNGGRRQGSCVLIIKQPRLNGGRRFVQAFEHGF